MQSIYLWGVYVSVTEYGKENAMKIQKWSLTGDGNTTRADNVTWGRKIVVLAGSVFTAFGYDETGQT